MEQMNPNIYTAHGWMDGLIDTACHSTYMHAFTCTHAHTRLPASEASAHRRKHYYAIMTRRLLNTLRPAHTLTRNSTRSPVYATTSLECCEQWPHPSSNPSPSHRACLTRRRPLLAA